MQVRNNTKENYSMYVAKPFKGFYTMERSCRHFFWRDCVLYKSLTNNVGKHRATFLLQQSICNMEILEIPIRQREENNDSFYLFSA